jgi:hypothetical protein
MLKHLFMMKSKIEVSGLSDVLRTIVTALGQQVLKVTVEYFWTKEGDNYSVQMIQLLQLISPEILQ